MIRTATSASAKASSFRRALRHDPRWGGELARLPMIISSMLGRTNVPSRPDARRAGGDLAGRRVPSRLLLAIAVVLVAATGSLAAGKAHEGFFIGRDGEF